MKDTQSAQIPQKQDGRNIYIMLHNHKSSAKVQKKFQDGNSVIGKQKV